MDMEITDRKELHDHNFILDHVILWLVNKIKIFLLPGWCNVCQKPVFFYVSNENLREDAICIWCRSSNRKRQMMRVFQKYYFHNERTVIWNTEGRGSFHKTLQKKYAIDYIATEYFGSDVDSGTIVKGVRNEDMCHTSFDSGSFDVVFSSDDLEHIPEPQEAINEISRVLKTGGRFIFTVPCHLESDRNDIRASRLPDGSIDYLKEPEFHGDPLNPSEGILVFTIFGRELFRMCEQAGMTCKAYQLYMPRYGILGDNAIIFVGEKER